MINDESKPTLGRYVLSYIQSFFVLRSARVSAATEIPTDASAFLLLDAADDCLRRGDFEQAVRYVNALRGEPRRVAADWLQEARYVLETRQAAEFLMTYAAAGGIGSVE
jgi:mitofilin